MVVEKLTSNNCFTDDRDENKSFKHSVRFPLPVPWCQRQMLNLKKVSLPKTEWRPPLHLLDE